MSREMVLIPKPKYEELLKNEKTNNDGEYNSSHNPSNQTGKSPIEDKQNTDSGLNAKNEPLKKEKGSVKHENLETDTTHRSQIGKGKSYIKRTPLNFLKAREKKFIVTHRNKKLNSNINGWYLIFKENVSVVTICHFIIHHLPFHYVLAVVLLCLTASFILNHLTFNH